LDQQPNQKEAYRTLILTAVLIVTTVALILGIRFRPPTDENDPFPHGLYPCFDCSYFHHAQSDPEQALTTCPTCGLTLLPQEDPL
jgi:hypothetical protein